ncbi:MAG TPA: wax ester/triacylglycerol synthase family O-acyltransferase [Solirubrobacteraceae bacterium]|nr:wax ester/triacylglycerol synthase family O-acyltransferase [Solirubrobacteraceae bacterium]
MRQFTSVDAQFIAAEDGKVHGHVTGLAVYEGSLTTDQIRNVIADRIHVVRPFRQRMVEVPFNLDLPYWVDDPAFDIDNHIVDHRLADPGDDRQLAEEVAKIMATPLDLSRPPWAIHVIRGLAGNRVALATTIHHSASDGVGMAELFAILHDPTPEVRALGGDDATPPPEPVPSRRAMLVRGLAGLPRQPLRFVRSLPRALPHLDEVVTLRPIPGVPRIAQLSRRLLLTADGDGAMLDEPAALAPRTQTTTSISSRRTAAFTSTPLEEIKAIKNHFGVTVNDVVMAIIAGALRAWLSERGELPGAPLAAMVPISVRAPEQSGSFGNRMAMMIPPLHTEEVDPERRLRLTHESMRSAKERHEAVPATLLQDANHFIPPVLLARAARACAIVASSPRRGAAANVLISNIPGSRVPQYMAGARLLAHYPLSAIFHGLGLNITVVSYGDQVDWGVAGDPEQIGDAWGLIEHVRAAQSELLAIAGASERQVAAR